MKKILGIDPSLTSTGWAILEYEENKLKDILKSGKATLFKKEYQPILLDYGRIITNSKDLDTKRIYKHYTEMNRIVDFYIPNIISIEDQYNYLNPKTLKKLSQVRGVFMFLACQYNIELYLYSPASIKKIVSGSGKADKEIIVNTINNYFNIELNVKNDNDKADAIAIALSYLFDRKKSKII